MREFKKGDSVKLKDGVIEKFKIDSCMVFNGERQLDDVLPYAVLIGDWWYEPKMLELIPIDYIIIKYVPFRHKFSKINYSNQ